MKVTINGKEEQLNQQKLSVVDLLKVKDVEMPDMVSVQLNGSILKREQFSSVFVKENDRLEFLYFMGGGARPRRARPRGARLREARQGAAWLGRVRREAAP